MTYSPGVVADGEHTELIAGIRDTEIMVGIT
jgi:hypothetical protein